MKNLKNEFAKLKKMSFEEKRWYLWEYYKFQFFVFILVIFLAGSFINSRFINPRPSTYLYIAWIAADANHFQLRDMEKAFGVIVDDPERYEVLVTNYTLTGDRQHDSALQTRFVSLIQLGAMDAIITTRHEVEGLIYSDNILIRTVDDVLEFLPDPSAHENRFVSAQEQFWAVSLEGSPFLEELGICSNDVFLCVIVNTKRFYEIAKALEVLIYGA
jgi:hypothetical protein